MLQPSDRSATPVGRRESTPADPTPMTTTVSPAAELVAAADLVLDASAISYRLYDIGYEIHLDEVSRLFGETDPARARPVRGEARAIVIPNLPVTLRLGPRRLTTPQGPFDVEASARVFDFGVVSLRFEVRLPEAIRWKDYCAVGSAFDVVHLAPAFDALLDEVMARISGAVDRLVPSPVAEDYLVLRIDRLHDSSGAPIVPRQLRDQDLAALVLDESRELTAVARRELLPHAFSYYADDLVLLSWDRALVIEPDSSNSDVEYLLEFANAQLLELRLFDDILDRELRSVGARVAAARARSLLFGRRYASLLAQLQTLVGDTTELVERAENAFRLTDDMYLARIYQAAMEIFRARTWRAGIDRKLGFLRDTYEMLNAESQAARAEALEIIIVLLIVAELLLGIFRR
jgi:hypothetical protein